MEKEIIIRYECADFVLTQDKAQLYELGLYPLCCHICGLLKPNIMKEQQDDLRGRN